MLCMPWLGYVQEMDVGWAVDTLWTMDSIRKRVGCFAGFLRRNGPSKTCEEGKEGLDSVVGARRGLDKWRGGGRANTPCGMVIGSGERGGFKSHDKSRPPIWGKMHLPIITACSPAPVFAANLRSSQAVPCRYALSLLPPFPPFLPSPRRFTCPVCPPLPPNALRKGTAPIPPSSFSPSTVHKASPRPGPPEPFPSHASPPPTPPLHHRPLSTRAELTRLDPPLHLSLLPHSILASLPQVL